jgi:hypothetical protein
VLRLRPDRPSSAFGLGAFAAIALASVAVAQPAPGTLPENGIFDPPNGQGVLNPEGGGSDPPPLIAKNATTFGNPSGYGAGKTGFDSTNARRKIQAAMDRRKEPQRLPPVVTTHVTPVPPLPRAPALPPAQPADPVTTGSVGPPYAPPYTQPPRPKPQPVIDPYEPLGIRAGSFILRPAIDVSGGYDSNPERAPSGKSSSFYVVAPELKAVSDWERHQFRASLRGSYDGYTELTSLNRPFFESILDGRIDVTSQTRVELQNRFQYSVDLPGSPNFETDVAHPTPYTNLGGTAGLFHRFNRLEIGGKASIDRTQYDDSELTDGTIVSNEDRNFSTYGLELRGSYEWSPGIRPFVAVAIDKRVYDLSSDAGGVQRDSRGLTPRIGSTFELSRQLTGEVSVGYLTRTYEDPQLQDINGIIADASLIWTATALTKFTFTAQSSVYESIDPEVSGVLARDVGVQVDHAFRDWLIGTLKFGYGLDDYVGTTQVDNRFSAAAGLTYKMNRNAQWKGEIRREQRTSNVVGDDYTANIFLLGLRLQE